MRAIAREEKDGYRALIVSEAMISRTVFTVWRGPWFAIRLHNEKDTARLKALACAERRLQLIERKR